MSAYSDQYVVYGYWNYQYAVGDVLATDGAASVNALATTSAIGNIYGDQWTKIDPITEVWTDQPLIDINWQKI
jgi:hypothetical protein